MTQEEKAKAYDEALERAKDYKNNIIHKEVPVGTHIMDYIFPELAESEDERIRKRLIFNFKVLEKTEWGGLEVKDILAWLEKQGEQKPITSLDMEPEVLDKVVNDCIFGNEKAAWSEEDEETSRGILNYLCLHDACELEGFDGWYNWLKSSIKDKVQSLSQPKEWSEEDEKMYLSIMSVLLSTIGTDKTSFTVTREMDWLKSIKERMGG